jgi:hypothetical protein
LGASTFGAFKNIMDKARLLNLLAGEFHPCIALNAKGFVGLNKWLDHGSPGENEKAVTQIVCSGFDRVPCGEPIQKNAASRVRPK